MKRGVVVSIVVALLAVGGMVYAFLTNASPYVTVAEAKQAGPVSVHVAGDLIKDTLKTDLANRKITFDMKDEKGEVMSVVYSGPPPANMGDATQVVAIGQMKDGVFHSDRMLIKCPSKNEGKQKA